MEERCFRSLHCSTTVVGATLPNGCLSRFLQCAWESRSFTGAPPYPGFVVTFFLSFLLVCDCSALAQGRNSFQESWACIPGIDGPLSHEGQIGTERRGGTPCGLLGPLLTWKETNLEPDSQVTNKITWQFHSSVERDGKRREWVPEICFGRGKFISQSQGE